MGWGAASVETVMRRRAVRRRGVEVFMVESRVWIFGSCSFFVVFWPFKEIDVSPR